MRQAMLARIQNSFKLAVARDKRPFCFFDDNLCGHQFSCHNCHSVLLCCLLHVTVLLCCEAKINLWVDEPLTMRGSKKVTVPADADAERTEFRGQKLRAAGVEERIGLT